MHHCPPGPDSGSAVLPQNRLSNKLNQAGMLNPGTKTVALRECGIWCALVGICPGCLVARSILSM